MPLVEVLAAIEDAEKRLTGLRESSAVPDQPDDDWVNAWLHRAHLDYWTRTPTAGQ